MQLGISSMIKPPPSFGNDLHFHPDPTYQKQNPPTQIDGIWEQFSSHPVEIGTEVTGVPALPLYRTLEGVTACKAVQFAAQARSRTAYAHTHVILIPVSRTFPEASWASAYPPASISHKQAHPHESTLVRGSASSTQLCGHDPDALLPHTHATACTCPRYTHWVGESRQERICHEHK